MSAHQSHIDHAAVQSLSDSTLYLCATSRLAQTLRAIPPSDECRVWRTPRTLTLGQWFADLGNEALIAGLDDLPNPLDTFSEGLLWEQVIASSLSDAAQLFDLGGMASAAAEALALQRNWMLPDSGAEVSSEGGLFLRWRDAFLDRCKEIDSLDLGGWNERVICLLEKGFFSIPERLKVVGFDRTTPLENRLFAALKARGAVVEFCSPSSVGKRVLHDDAVSAESGHTSAIALADSNAECAAVVAWAIEQMAKGTGRSIGIVAPDLANVREKLHHLLDDALVPESLRPGSGDQARPFNFSLGYNLAEQPLVRVALDLLSVATSRGVIEQTRLSGILLAGSWSAADSEADERARLDAAMRQELPCFTSGHALLRLAERLAQQGHELCPLTVDALRGLLEMSSGGPNRRHASEWADHFRACLGAAGWPGERSLSSSEFQARAAFAEVLDGLAALDALLGPIGATDAVRRLNQICRQRIFQPETRGTPTIQVLGVLESAGLSFDALWVMGMNDDTWPPAPRPNPLLPATVQREAGSARSSAEVEFEFAQRVHSRLLFAAPEITFSYALADGNRIRRPSPLLEGMAQIASHYSYPLTLASQLANAHSGACEAVDDTVAPPVAAGEVVGGGSSLLRAQAICPAWAFYQYRLGAQALKAPVEGFNPADRGTLVHATLEAFWTEVTGSNALQSLSSDERAAAISRAAIAGIAQFEKKSHQTFSPRIREIEAKRLERILGLWLDIEAKRTVPFTVVAKEEQRVIRVADIAVNVVIDRIDELDDGRRIVIDYKTGASIDIKNWASQRITEPQVPIYAALAGEDVSAIAFAKVQLDKPAFVGVAKDSDMLPGVPGIGDDKQKLFPPAAYPSWTSVIQHWETRLQAIAQEIKVGHAPVLFSDEKELQYCEVLPLLRLPEYRRLLAQSGNPAP